MIWLVLDMVHSGVVLKAIVFMNVKPVDVEIDGKQLINKQKFVVREHMLQWINTEAAK